MIVDKRKSGIINLNDGTIDELRKYSNIYFKKDIDRYNKFNRFGTIIPDDVLDGCREYKFFTKPDLHIFKDGNSSALNPQLSSYPFFQDMFKRYKSVLQQLQISLKSNGPFINLLSNSITSDIDLPSITGTDMQGPTNVYGDNIDYAWTSVSSDVDHDFSVEIQDSVALENYFLLKTWDEYERLKAKGKVYAPNIDKYIFGRRLHDQVAVYKIIVGADNTTIIYYAKLYGVFPRGVPRDAFSNLNAGNITFSQSFHSAFVKDNDPIILASFNKLVNNYISGRNYAEMYNKDTGLVNGDWVYMPYIVYDESGSRPVYKLKWKR